MKEERNREESDLQNQPDGPFVRIGDGVFLLESMVTIPGMLPGIRLGLSNLVTMYCLFFLGKGAGYTMAVMKSLFVLLTRGFVAGLLSLSEEFCR